MNLLIKQAQIIDPCSPFNGQSMDILVENGTIKDIGTALSSTNIKIVDHPSISVSPGWIDSFANFGDPGYEYKETLESGAAAAAAGGFTQVMVIPNTDPCIHNKSTVEYICQKSRSLPVHVHPIGAVTRNTDGKELAEMYDMKASGAVAFSDGINSIQSSGVLMKALQYVKTFNGTIIQLPDDKHINAHGLMHEGVVSTQLGLPGRPAMAEELIVARDIELAAYANSNIHFTGISTARSLSLIREAKQKGIAVTCSVTPYHLFYSDEDLRGYDTNLKVNPPLRGISDRDALRNGIEDGTVDCIASHHLPHEYDSKVLEFEYAKFGMTGLETLYGLLRTAIPTLTNARWVELLAIHPAKLFGLTLSSIAIDQPACLTIFSPDEKWMVDAAAFKSKSRNTPLHKVELTGKVIGIVNKNHVILN